MADHLNGLGTYPVFRFTIQDPEVNDRISRDFLSYEGTVKSVVNNYTRPEIKYKVGVKLMSQQEIHEFLTFMETLRARKNPVWLPFPLKMFKQNATYTSGNNTITVYNNEFMRIWAGYERLFFLMFSGDLLTYKITNVAYGLNPETDQYTITIGTNLNRNIADADVRFFSLLPLVRLDTDEISMEYLSTELATCSLEFVELVNEYPA